jgi:Mg-chelatase subunit ChlD
MPSNKRLTLGLLTGALGLGVGALILANSADHEALANIDPPTEQTPPTLTSTKKKPAKVVVAAEPPKVDVVFVLDTTGSMSGLLSGAKRKIWSIANRIQNGQPRPEVRMGLIGYRDVGDDYVTRRYALTENIDEVYSKLKRFRAGGGGDTPEHVNKGLDEAINKMQWRQGKGVLKLVFLVGDAPPHEGRGGLRSASLAQEAAQKGITINTVRCGRSGSTGRKFAKIASLSGGIYATIRQDGAMVARSTPYDKELAKLNDELSTTALHAGGEGTKRAYRSRMVGNRGMGSMSKADSATYRARSGHLDSGDLLAQMKKGKKLHSFREAELPPAVAAKPMAQRRRYIRSVAKTRRRINKKILSLAKDRDAYLKKARKGRGSSGFDDVLGGALKRQGEKAGIAY